MAAPDFDYDYAISLAQQALALMAKHRVPPTPDNFAVWFSYALGTPAELKLAITAMIGNSREFDAATNSDLHRSYVAANTTAREVDLGLSAQLSTLMANAKQYLANAIDDNRSQLRALGEVSVEASGGTNPRQLIEGLVQELSQATNRATALEAKFAAAASELDNIRDSLEEAEARSKTDMPTGLANRRALDEFLRLQQRRAAQGDGSFSLFMIDVDQFKTFNDSYGHQVGDQVLKLIAGVLQERIRDGDMAGRYGGDELVVVCPGTDLAACHDIAETIRSTIAQRRIRRRTTGEDISSVTISVGVAAFRPGEPTESLIERCDRALYCAKREGRNRVMTENDLGESIPESALGETIVAA